MQTKVHSGSDVYFSLRAVPKVGATTEPKWAVATYLGHKQRRESVGSQPESALVDNESAEPPSRRTLVSTAALATHSSAEGNATRKSNLILTRIGRPALRDSDRIAPPYYPG